MIVCGDDGLARRLATELHELYGESVVLVMPPAGTAERPRARFGARRPTGLRVIEATELRDETLADAGIADATALALAYGDDETNIRAALAARRANPGLRLVIRLYNRRLGAQLADLLDQAGAGADPQGAPAATAGTTVLSDADTAAPALAATAVAGTSRAIPAGGVLLRAVEYGAPAAGPGPQAPLATLALLSTGTTGAGTPYRGQDSPELLPDDDAVAAATERGRVVLERIASTEGDTTRPDGRGAPLAALFSRQVRWSFAGISAVVLALAGATWATSGDASPIGPLYVVLLDLFAIDDPARGQPVDRQVLQLLAGFAGLLLLPLVTAAVLEVFGTFRAASSLRRPRRGQSGHVVLLGLGKIGGRVLRELRALRIPVVCVEADPSARGVAVARRLRVPTVIGDVTQEGVLEAAGIERAAALLALTSKDTTNLEAVLYARTLAPGLRAALRLYDDDFATAVYRTMRAAYPAALTRSRSVSTLAAPAFAVAMLGRQIVGAIPVERRVLLIATLDVEGHPLLEGRTVADVFTAGTCRVVAVDRPDDRDGSGVPAPPGDYVLRAGDRAVIAVTQRGLAEFVGRRTVVP
ncbi:NAD-binding protein [Streptomyces sp. 8L]|uniref:NAD-binding protein n=1 Tax=Streptomyces sp. 8L TaxID=2877242 RepID=UPI001CD6AC98|nr:NAD(P)-binding protein [Streptomyces sp. 8L]MCA1223275.1 NAD-binding protein [Streptomyces sp. 8L]